MQVDHLLHSDALSSHLMMALNSISIPTPNINSTEFISPSIHSSYIYHIIQLNKYPMITREKKGHSKPKALPAHIEPTLIKQTLSHP